MTIGADDAPTCFDRSRFADQRRARALPDFQELRADAIAAPGFAYAPRRAPCGRPRVWAPVGNSRWADRLRRRIRCRSRSKRLMCALRPIHCGAQGERCFFNDQRASRIGDILTVEIEISDKSARSPIRRTVRVRSVVVALASANFFGLKASLADIFGGSFDPENLVGGQAEAIIDRREAPSIAEEKIELSVAAVSLTALPNGNLIIAGRQEVRINAELRELTVSGMIRPEDINANNTIRHDQIAEARVSYGGRGQISAVQRPNWWPTHRRRHLSLVTERL